ncbi:MAG: FKBP-type peptidyl-prolyl cis-trans isomerase [Muribaculaceae bacterium]|nr:FKBP-type peptidyl-prolyl cis-trans isomerase [Muribaculaceae bacterium]
MKIKYLALGVIALGAFGLAGCKGESKSADADSAVETMAADDEYQPAPVLTDKQKAVSDSVFTALKGKEKQIADTAVYTTPSGLRYMVLKNGEGKSPTAADNVKVHYTGTLPDGTVFDSSVERGEPITFPLNGVIRGWTEGLQLMKEGGKTVFYIPSALAYGPAGAGGQIGPNQDLVFEVELIEVNPE